MEKAAVSYRDTMHAVKHLHSLLQRGKLPDWISGEAWLLSRTLSFARTASRLPKEEHAGAEDHFRSALSLVRTLSPKFSLDDICEACCVAHIDESALRLLPLALCADVLWEIFSDIRKKRVPKTAKVEAWESRIYATLHLDYEAVWERASAVEKILLDDPLGIYEKCDRTSKAAYRSAVYRIAKRSGTDEYRAAASVLKQAKAEGKDLSEVLFDREKSNSTALYFLLVALCTVLVSAFVGISLRMYGAWRAAAMAVLLLLPLYAFFREALLFLFAKKRAKPLLALSPGSCPSRGVLTVITTLLEGENEDKDLFDALELYYLRNRGKGWVFGILGDLPSHSAPEAAEDEKMLAYAKGRIDALNTKYGAHFCLYVRKRGYVASEKRFFGKERKRGALLALARLLRGGDREEFLEITEPKDMDFISYVCTLDGDTALPYDAIETMLCIMEHPHNRPTVQNGRVVRGIGILQPAMATRLSSATKTPFSVIMAAKGGYDPYGRYTHDAEDVVFGHGGYCGKGMFCVDTYLAVLDGAFPDEKILSHDFLEGQRLSCRTVSTVTFLDTQPQSISAYYQRQERWVRGDVQALPFAFGLVRNARGEKVKSPVVFSERLRILDHVLCAITPIGILRALLFCSFAFSSWKAGICLTLLLFSPYLFRVLMLSIKPRAWVAATRSFSAITCSDLWHSIFSLCYRVIFACHEGIVNAKATFLALWRMYISKQHLLSWTTAAAAERGMQHGGVFSYAWYLRFSVGFGVALLFAKQPLGKVFGVLWLLAPICAFLLDRPFVTRKRGVGSHTLRRLRAYAMPIWRYFEDHVTEKELHLPPDNVQWFPHTQKQIAHRTSPTNIGLYLLSCLSALRFSLITPHVAVTRLLSTLQTLSNLERCHGHFYNWYDTQSGARIGAPYLSAVDSGNLACSLVAAAKACETYAAYDTRFLDASKQMLTLAHDMDFSILYNEKRAALAIGFDTEKNEAMGGYYDLYCSEARSAVYFAVAMGQIPALAWHMLARPILTHDRRIGVSSWSGSAFEYFMPTLWLSVPQNSFSEEMLSYAAYMQIGDAEGICTDDGCYTLFGRSEGAYYAFDDRYTYQYQPCGVSMLGAKPGLSKERLIMPYATFLMLPFAKGKHAALASQLYQNLDAMEALDMWGDYGLYESLDMTPSRVGGGYAIVRSVMAHHLGMSLIALANTAFDDWIPACFDAFAPMRAAKILLEERIPTDAMPAYAEGVESETPPTRRQIKETSGLQPVSKDGAETYAVLSNTHAFVMASSGGTLYLRSGKYDISMPPESDTEEMLRALPPLFWMHANGKVYSPTMLGAADTHAAQFSFSVDDTQILYQAKYTDGVTATLFVALSFSADLFSFTLGLYKDGASVPFALNMLMRPVLCEQRAYTAHPTFSDLFVTSEFDEAEKCITVTHRSRGAEGDVTMTLCANALAALGAQTALDRILPLGYDRETLLRLPYRAEEICRFSAPRSAIVPALFLTGKALGKTTLTLGIGHGTDAAPRLPLSRLRAEHRMLAGGISHMDDTLSSMLYFALHRETRLLCVQGDTHMPFAAREELYRFGISGDLPIFLFTLDDIDTGRASVQKTLFAWKYLRICAISSDLVFAISEKDLYEKPILHMLKDMIREAGLSFFENRKGGIFILSEDDARAAGLYLRAAWTWGKTVPMSTMPRKIMAPRHTGEGRYAMGERRVVLYKGRQAVPWSHILSNGVFSTVLTHDTLGFTFFTNARECRVTPWYPEAISERCGERLLLQTGKLSYDMCASATTWEITPQKAVYIGHIGMIAYEVHVLIPDRRKRKEMLVRIANMGGADASLTLHYEAEVLLGASVQDAETVYVEKTENGICATTATNSYTKGYTAEFTTASDKGGICAPRVRARTVCVGNAATLSSGERWEVTFALSVFRTGERRIEAALPAQAAPCGAHIDTGYPYLDALANTWLPVQIYHSRLWARCGFWQPGGAYGFRDQLQDAMAAVYLHPKTLKRQIFRAAAHQYRQGDVQHWWHALPLHDPGKFHRGIRSRCSDDYLWLALACAHYVAVTGDKDILDARIRYIESPVLAESEHERYEEPLRSETKESLYMHCVRALEHGFSFGAHGLVLMGSGDWNDGMNAVGIEGRGESVWGSMFLLYVLAKFLPLCEMRGDEEGARRYKEVIKALALSIETHAWNGSWYLRAWYDDGTPMGEKGQAEAEIDLLPQAFAAIINREVRIDRRPPFDAERVRSAMLAAYERLYDEKIGTFALLAPPFQKTKGMHDPGYIASYIPGVRENGGQYTHAAVWGAMGLFAIGDDERGARVLRSLSPIYLTRDAIDLARYKKEPYALCGDVLRAEGRCGEGGWSLYTGSAAWYLRLLLSLFGKKEQPQPEIPKHENA